MAPNDLFDAEKADTNQMLEAVCTMLMQYAKYGAFEIVDADNDEPPYTKSREPGISQEALEAYPQIFPTWADTRLTVQSLAACVGVQRGYECGADRAARSVRAVR